LVGLATDGPENKVSLMRDERDLLRLYGGLYTERFTLEATGTSVTLDYEPYRVPSTSLNSVLRDYLYAPAVSGQQILFGSVGGSGAQLDLQYSPYLGPSDLLWAGRKWLQQTGQMPYIARVPGSRASVEVGNWKFSARYHGQKYNNVRVVYTGSTLTVSGLEPNYPTLTYSGYNVNDLRELVERDFEIGTSPVYIERADTVIPTFSQTMTGGADGVFDTSSFQSILDGLNMPADCSHVVFLTPLTSSFVQSVSDMYRETNVQPRMFFFAAPEFTTTAELYLFYLNTWLPARHPMIGMVLGTVGWELDGRTVSRYAVESVGVALAQSQNSNPTNMAIPAKTFSPQLTEADLDNFKLGGIMCVTRHIMADISTYEAVTSARTETFLYSSKVAEIAAIAYPYLTPFLGSILPMGPNAQLAQGLKQALSAIEWLTVESVDCLVVLDTMYVTISGILPDEILKISFTVKNV